MIQVKIATKCTFVNRMKILTSGFSPATLALTLLSLELELFHKDWFAITTGLQSLVQVTVNSLLILIIF